MNLTATRLKLKFHLSAAASIRIFEPSPAWEIESPRNIPSHTVPHSLCNSDFSGRKKKSRCLLMSYMMMECSSPLFSKGSQGGDISSGKVGVCVNQLHPTPPLCSNNISHWVQDLAHQQTLEDTW